MVENGVDILSADPGTGFCVLHVICKGNEPTLLRELLTWDVEVNTPTGRMPLYASAHQPLGENASCKYGLRYSSSPSRLLPIKVCQLN
jgi:hypothetical protein